MLTSSRCVCINLDRRTDRWQSVTRRFSELGLEVARVSALEGLPTRPGPLSRGEQSLVATNLRILEDAPLDRPLCVFEDDVRFLAERRPLAVVAAVEAELPARWGLLFLGAHLFGRAVRHPQVSPHLVRLVASPRDDHVYLGGTQAVVYHPSAIALIRSIPESVVFAQPWDVFLSRAIVPALRCFLANPAFAFQIEDYSDLVGAWTKRRRFIRANERRILRGVYSRTALGRWFAALTGAAAVQRRAQIDSGVRVPPVP